MKNTSAVDAAVGPVLFSAEQIAARVQRLGSEIAEHYIARDAGEPADSVPLVVAILKGSVLFVGDLLRAIDIPLEVEFLPVSSYGSAVKSSGVVRIGEDIDHCIAGRDILLVEDIVDSGATLKHLRHYFERFGASSIRTCSLLLRNSRDPGSAAAARTPREANPVVDYWGFDLASETFVIGYGLDHNQRYRNLPFIAEFLAIQAEVAGTSE